MNYAQESILGAEPLSKQLISLGFWPGGDRDGNPFVTAKITKEAMHKTIIQHEKMLMHKWEQTPEYIISSSKKKIGKTIILEKIQQMNALIK